MDQRSDPERSGGDPLVTGILAGSVEENVRGEVVVGFQFEFPLFGAPYVGLPVVDEGIV
jgi:hypothetical protein